MPAFGFPLRLAPERLWQSINPWTFAQSGGQIGLVNVDLGLTPHPETETRILDEVGSYGRQLGRLGDALEVLVRHVDRSRLDGAECDALDILLGQLAQIRRVKREEADRR